MENQHKSVIIGGGLAELEKVSTCNIVHYNVHVKIIEVKWSLYSRVFNYYTQIWFHVLDEVYLFIGYSSNVNYMYLK